jgi:N-methylhydantoinase A
VTDAAAVLGYIDPEYFLGGRMPLDLSAARSAIREIGERIGQSEVATAYGIMVIANERMVGAIREITVDQGVDPRESLLVAGGGAAGLNMVPIARELGCRRILIPRTASAFSACGAHHSDVIAEFSASHITDSNSFDVEGVNQTLTALERQMDDFADGLRRRRLGTFRKEFFVEARYSQQAWELEVPLRVARITSPTHVEAIVADFHEAHHRVYAVTDPGQTVECIYWKGRLTGILDKPPMGPPIALPEPEPRPRTAYFPETGASEVPAFLGAALRPGDPVYGPAIIEEATTTVVLYPGSTAWATESGNYLIEVAG